MSDLPFLVETAKNSNGLLTLIGDFFLFHDKCFFSFEFKIRLIKLGLSFQKQKFLYSNSQPTDSHSVYYIIERHLKIFFAVDS